MARISITLKSYVGEVGEEGEVGLMGELRSAAGTAPV